MHDSTTTDENPSHPGAQVALPFVAGARPQPGLNDARTLADLADDEVRELCDDLERWLGEELLPPA
jgi:hypothetical protein